MELLSSAKLYGGELLAVKTDELVRRYNRCLQRVGIEPTSLSEFSIDGLGWSPEIAAERDEYDYLNAGGHDPIGIILTPDQKNAPLYNPFNSFDKQLVTEYFERFIGEIADITLSEGICVR